MESCGLTPLYYAVVHQQYDAVQFLLEKGAKAEYPYCNGKSVMMCAMEVEYNDAMIDTLVRGGVDEWKIRERANSHCSRRRQFASSGETD